MKKAVGAEGSLEISGRSCDFPLDSVRGKDEQNGLGAGIAAHRDDEAGDEELKGGGVEDEAGLLLVPLEPRLGLGGFTSSLGALSKFRDHVATLLYGWNLKIIRAACEDFAY